jgi:hypothetical protein
MCAGTSAWAQTVASVGVQGDAQDNPARAKVIEELRAQGYDVREIDPDGGLSSGGPPLSARLTVQGRRIDVRVVVRRKGQYERREAVIELGQTDDEQTTAALRAAEFLRVSLLDLGWAVPEHPSTQPQPPLLPFEDKKPEPAKPRPPAPAPPPERGLSLAASAGAAMGYSTGGFGTQPWVVLGLAFPVGKTLRARVSGMIPISHASEQAPAGVVRMRTTLVGPSVEWSFLRRQYAELQIEGGIHAVSVGISATANPGYASETSTKYAAMPYAGARVLALPGRFKIGLGGFVGTMWPREEVRAQSVEVATWGALVAGGVLLAEVGMD